ncbi:antitoxin family protein [Thermococcus zilligii]|uniref:antitoxin family protein n=1 Tax=Thermococcus zilligii TaxID=54076 RepID=UPI00029AE9B1|nr:antitoxin family protein [Thermococcus zilligii]
MGEIIEVVYENGVLKPPKPLKLEVGQKFMVMRKEITKERFEEDPTDYPLRLREEET